jgi:hypothetical protein
MIDKVQNPSNSRYEVVSHLIKHVKMCQWTNDFCDSA